MDELERTFYLTITRFYANPIIEDTPVRTGVTRASWYLLRVGKGKYELVNTNDLIVEYLEEGTKPHIIEPKEKKALAFDKDGKRVVVKKAQHPGTKGKHWIKKILNSQKRKEEAEKFLSERLKKIFNLNVKE